jgi:hypothetical protein
MTSSTYLLPTNARATTTADQQLLIDPITIKADELDIGRGGMIRIWLSLETAGDVDFELTVTHLNILTDIQKLNADQDFVIKSKGLYRFDIDIEPGNRVNIRSSVAITKVNKLKFHKIVIGA